MLLEYAPGKQTYILRVKRSEGVDVQQLIKEHGLDYSSSASHSHEAVLFSREPCAVLHFFDSATPECKSILAPLKEQIDLSWAPTSNAHIKVPIDKELWGFQKASVSYALNRRDTLIGDQPGLGKTPIAIAYANEISAKRVLVICPANIRLQWALRIREWTTMAWPYIIYPILKGSHGVHPQANWTIVSYDLARTPAIQKALMMGTYDLLILDEAHFLKTADSMRTRAVFGGGGTFHHLAGIADRCGSTLALTGTPLPNRPREAYTMARNLCWDSIDFATEEKFRERFNPSMTKEIIDQETGKTKFVIDERTGRHYELQNRLRANFMTRHLKRDVMPQLKLPIFDIISMQETGPVKAALKAESLLDIDPDTIDDLESSDFKTKGDLAVVRRMMGIALAPQVAEYADMLIQGGEEKLVIFAWHVEVLNILQNALQKHGVIRIDGSVGAAKKQRLVDEFINDPSKDVIIGNIQSMGTGTDGLQLVSYHLLAAEASWVAGDNEQMVDRLDRGGQNNTVQADFFVAPNSISEKVLASSLRKRQTTHKALDARMT